MDEADMTPKATRALVPALRFPEFTDPWEEKEMKPYLEEHFERVPADTDLPIFSSTRTGLKLQKDYYDGRELINDGEYRVVPDGFFVYRHMSDDGTFKFNINHTGQKIAVSKEYPVFTTVELYPDFLIYKINDGVDFKRFALMQKKGGTRTRLYFNILCLWKTLLPSFPEQQKIAECLSSIDELITLEARKIDTLKAHKKGLMQQLFPAEGETIPKLRFPEFRDAGEWEEKRLGEIGSVLMCKRIFAEETNDREGVPFFKIGTLGGIADSFISKQLFEEYRSKYNYPKKGEVLLTCSGTVGKCIPYDGADAYYQDSNIVWIANSTRVISNEFLFFKLSSVDWSRLNSTTITRIYGDDLRALSLVFPADPGEQQKIADCLTSVDELIILETQKLDALKAHKKGLMQQLFPSLGEVRE